MSLEMDQLRYIRVLALLLCFTIPDVYGKHTSRKVHRTNGSRVVGGSEVPIQDYPYLVRLLLAGPDSHNTNSYSVGAGTIATEKCVITAAHCLTGIVEVLMRVGSADFSHGGTTYNSKTFMQYPEYNSKTSDFDIGIIKLSNPIATNGDSISTIKFPSSGCSVTPGTNLTTIGWGATSENSGLSEKLRAVTVRAVSEEDCKKSYSYISPQMLCAGVPEGGRDSCGGDSGGPIIVTETKEQVGVVSFGIGCARPNIPGVYTYLCDPNIQKWLKEMECA